MDFVVPPLDTAGDQMTNSVEIGANRHPFDAADLEARVDTDHPRHGGQAGWTGTVTALRLKLVSGAGISFELDGLRGPGALTDVHAKAARMGAHVVVVELHVHGVYGGRIKNLGGREPETGPFQVQGRRSSAGWGGGRLAGRLPSCWPSARTRGRVVFL